MLKMKRVIVTPKLAEKWLSGHENYRNLRTKYVRRLAADMVAGNFREVGDPIRFDSSGALVDGQHRLSAIVRSGVELPMWVARGVDDIEVVDSGTPRHLGDVVTRFSNIKHGKDVVAAVRRLHFTGRNLLCDSSIQPTNSQIFNYIQEHPELSIAVSHGILLGRAKILTKPEAISTLHYSQIKGVNYESAHKFLSSVYDGIELKRGNPALTVRDKLMCTALGNGSSTLARFYFILRGLRASLDGVPLTTIRYIPGESKWPEF